MKKIGDLTLLEVVKTMKEYEMKTQSSGGVVACDEIIADMKILCQDDFVNKYTNILKRLAEFFEADREENSVNGTVSQEMEYFIDYNNKIVDVLKIITPIYEFWDSLDSSMIEMND